MPIELDRFENAADLSTPPTGEQIVRFLLAHDEHAFTRQEIATAIEVNPETVGTNLTRLKQRGLVRHREPYWTFTDDYEHARDAMPDTYRVSVRRDGQPTDNGIEPRREGTIDVADDHTETDADLAGVPGADASTPASASTTPPQHHNAATEFVGRVRTRLDDAIDGLYLFGSVARDTADEDSDIDVLAVISNDVEYAAIDDQLLDIAYDIQLEHGVTVEVHSIRVDEFRTRLTRGDPFIRTVVEDGDTGV